MGSTQSVPHHITFDTGQSTVFIKAVHVSHPDCEDSKQELCHKTFVNERWWRQLKASSLCFLSSHLGPVNGCDRALH